MKEVIYGTRAIIEAIHAGQEFDKVLVQRDVRNDLMAEMLKLARAHAIPVSKVPQEKLNRVTRKNHQGAIAFISAISYSSVDLMVSTAYEKGDMPFIVILDRVTDVRNFGAIARTAECAGANGIIIPSKGGARIGADAVKTSAGALNHIPIARVDNLKEEIISLKDQGLYVVACTEKADTSLYDLDLNCPLALIMGSEEDGVSPAYLKLADGKGSLPLKGRIESLNVSVATGIALFEALRQRS